MNRQRLIFALFLLICVLGFWRLRGMLPAEAPQATPYAARPELLDDAPALATQNEAQVPETREEASEDAPLTTMERMEAAFAETQEEAPPDLSCNMAPIREVTETRTNRIYQWRDENGVLHFGDRPPAGVASTEFDADEQTTVEYFQLEIDFRGANTLPYFRSQIQAQATRIYEILAGMVGDQRLKQVDLNVIIFPDRASYQEYAAATGGNALANAGGFYTNADNEAVTYVYEDEEQTLAVTRHEALHVILNGLLATGPLWLHEGMAEYFEQMSMRDQFARISPNTEWLTLARTAVEQGYLTDLADFLDATPEQWRSGQEALNYALGWSLVYFLLDNNNGRRAFTALLQKTADDYCTPTSSSVQLNLNYPGGIPALQRDYFAWLADTSEKNSHSY